MGNVSYKIPFTIIGRVLVWISVKHLIIIVTWHLWPWSIYNIMAKILDRKRKCWYGRQQAAHALVVGWKECVRMLVLELCSRHSKGAYALNFVYFYQRHRISYNCESSILQQMIYMLSSSGRYLIVVTLYPFEILLIKTYFPLVSFLNTNMAQVVRVPRNTLILHYQYHDHR